MNLHATAAIYRFEMARTFRTLVQSIAAPVISTSLYFIVFGAAIGSRISNVDGVSYGAFIVPGLMMLAAGPGCCIEIEAEGAEAEAAVAALEQLVSAKFDEEE